MSGTECCLIIFAKEPVPGHVKNRLSSVIGEDHAAALYKAFLKDTYALTHFIPVHFRILAYESFGGIPQYLYSTFPHFVFYPQHGDDMGARIQDAVVYARHMGAEHVVIMGVESPTMPHELIAESFERLKHHDFVLGPRRDGGFYLIGMNDFDSCVFKEVEWGSDRVFLQIKDNIEEIGKTYYVLCNWYDIDRIEDLKQFKQGSFSSTAERTSAVIDALFHDLPKKEKKDL